MTGTGMLFDAARPDPARVYSALIGGKDNYSPDREIARALEAADPPRGRAPGILPSSGARGRARENEAFILAAARRAAGEGIGQFVIAGCGFPRPAGRNVHDAAREACPGARACYVDSGPLPLAHARALLSGPGLGASGADPADPAAVLTDPDVAAVIDPARAMALVIPSLLHFTDGGAARRMCAAWTGAMPAGSWLIASAAWFEDRELLGRLREAYTPADIRPHPPETFASFFAGLAIVPPGITSAKRWTAGVASRIPCRQAGYVLAGAGVKVPRLQQR